MTRAITPLMIALLFILTGGLLALTGCAVSHGRAATSESDTAPIPPPFNPYKMRDWAQCADGKQIYDKDPRFPLETPLANPCVDHGGVHSYGLGNK